MPTGMQVLALLGGIKAEAIAAAAEDTLTKLEDPAINSIVDGFGHKVIQFLPAGASAVNWWLISNGNTGDPAILSMTADGPSANLDIDFQPKGTGVLSENGSAVAFGPLLAAPSTEGASDPAAKLVLDQIIADLKLCRIYAT